MYSKFARSSGIRVLTHVSSVKRRSLCFFQRVQREDFLFSTGLIAIFRKRKASGGFSIELRRNRPIYNKVNWKDTLYNHFLPQSFSGWKALLNGIDAGGKFRAASSNYRADNSTKILTIFDSEEFNISYCELSQIFYAYKELRESVHTGWGV